MRLSAHLWAASPSLPCARLGWRQCYHALLFEHPTGAAQVMCALMAVTRGLRLLVLGPVVPPATARVLYEVMGPKAWGVAFLLVGIAQAVAAGADRYAWRRKWFAAQCQALLTTYALLAYVFTGQEDYASLPFLTVLVPVEWWIAFRARQDREINGSERRQESSARAPVVSA